MHRLFYYLFYPQQVTHDTVGNKDSFGGEFQYFIVHLQQALCQMWLCHTEAVVVQFFAVLRT